MNKLMKDTYDKIEKDDNLIEEDLGDTMLGGGLLMIGILVLMFVLCLIGSNG